MQLRHTAMRDEARRLMRSNANRPPDEFRERLVKGIVIAGAIIGIAVGVFITNPFGRHPPTINVNGNTAMGEKGFCAVRCDKSGSGAFYSNSPVYVEDASSGHRYKKMFYSRDGELLVEGIGNETNRWFFNPDYEGKAHLANAQIIGGTWYTFEYYTGEKAERKWNEVKTGY